MQKRDPFPVWSDGLPWLSDPQIEGMGLFFLRISYLLFSSIPLVLSMLDAIAGVAADLFYCLGMLALLLPLLVDVVRRFLWRSPLLDSLLIALTVLFLVWDQAYTPAAVMLLFYHLADLSLCLLLRRARTGMSGVLDHAMETAALNPPENSAIRAGDHLHIQEGEMLSSDVRILSGSVLCSLQMLDPKNGEFEAGAGDVLFSGTYIVEGEALCEVTSVPAVGTPRLIRRKLSRCLQTTGRPCRRLCAAAVPVQALYLLIVLMNITFFDFFINAHLLAFCSLFLLFGLFTRFLRARELFLLGDLMDRGIYPESFDTVLGFHAHLDSAVHLDQSRLHGEREAPGAVRYRVSRRLPRKHLHILAYASESSRLIADADLVLLYRGHDSLEAPAQKSAEIALLTRLILLFSLVAATVSVLLFALFGTIIPSVAVLLFAVLFSAFSLARAFRKK